jgi:hypothetical protein
MRKWQKIKVRLENIFAAVGCAEGNDPETALQVATALVGAAPPGRHSETLKTFARAIGLEGVRLVYGVAYV